MSSAPSSSNGGRRANRRKLLQWWADWRIEPCFPGMQLHYKGRASAFRLRSDSLHGHVCDVLMKARIRNAQLMKKPCAACIEVRDNPVLYPVHVVHRRTASHRASCV